MCENESCSLFPSVQVDKLQSVLEAASQHSALTSSPGEALGLFEQWGC